MSIDELGFKKIPQGSHQDFFEVIRLRYEQRSMMVTANKNFEDWSVLFEDAVLASPIIDKLVHHASIIRITGPSYRVKDLVDNIDLPDTNKLPQKVEKPRNGTRVKNYTRNED